MIEFYSGLGLWDALAQDLPVGDRREAAIAYIGHDAADYLAMAGQVDVLVFDGCDSNIANGLINLDEIQKLMDNDVRLFSRPGLHSKMMYVQDGDRALAVVGSANISHNSVTNLFESAVVFDDATEVERVRLAIDATHAGLSPIGPAWMDQAQAVPKIKRAPGPKWKPVTAPLTDPMRALSLLPWTWNGPAVPAQVEQARRDVACDSGVSVEVFPIEGADYMRLAVGDGVLMVGWPDRQYQPAVNARIDEPALIRALVDTGRNSNQYWMVYATRADAQHRRWDQVRDALTGARWNDQWRKPLTGRQRDAVHALFRHEHT